MADKSWGDVSKEPVQDSHAHEKPLQTPRQETGVPQSQGFDRALPGPPQPLQGEISSTTKKLAEIIAALLVAMLNLPWGSVTTACTMTRAAVQFLQTPLEDVDEIDKMKPEVQEIKHQLKGIRPKISELVEKVNCHFQDTYSVVLRSLKKSLYLLAFHPYCLVFSVYISI